MCKPLLGLWVFDHHSVVTMAAYLDDMKALGFQTASLVVGNFSGTFTWPPAAIREAVAGLVERDIEAVLMTCPSPTRYSIDRHLDHLGGLADCGIAGIEYDLEGQFLERAPRTGAPLVHGFDDLAAAADYLVAKTDALCDENDLRWEVTTHTGHAEHGPRAMVLPHANRANFQWYGVRKRPSGLVEWDGRYGPGNVQRFGMRLAESIPVDDDPPRVCVGLPAWSQTFPGHTPAEAMQANYDGALLAEPFEVRYWDSRRILGAKPNGYSREFIQGLADAD